MAEQTNPFINNDVPEVIQPAVIKKGGLSIFGSSLKSKLIFGVLGLVILVECVIVYRSFTTPSPALIADVPPQNQGVSEVLPLSVGSLGGAKIALVGEKKDYKVGETVPVTIRVSTGGYISDGVDVVLKYDPNLLEATSSAITNGNIFQNYPAKSVDTQAGLINISAISTATGDGFNGMGNFATINFVAKSIDRSEVTVNFTKDSTSDSNVIKQKDAMDILDSVTNATINITTQGGTANASSCGVRMYQSCVDSEGRTGSYFCSAIEDPFSCQVGCFREESGSDLGCNVISN